MWLLELSHTFITSLWKRNSTCYVSRYGHDTFKNMYSLFTICGEDIPFILLNFTLAKFRWLIRDWPEMKACALVGENYNVYVSWGMPGSCCVEAGCWGFAGGIQAQLPHRTTDLGSGFLRLGREPLVALVETFTCSRVQRMKIHLRLRSYDPV